MKILILGGTQFVGRHITEAALKKGHEVTLFNRGQTNQELFPNVEKLTGDRSSNLESLKGKEWDVVIDTSGYLPGVVAETASLLKDTVQQYIFISSVSAYDHFQEIYVDETHPVGKLEDESVQEINGETYGPLKALCEQTIENIMPNRTLNIRPGLVVGPHDPTDRFTYWVMRFARGGEVLVPGEENRPVQWIDVRDLAKWTIDMAEKRETGTFNAVGYEEEVTMKDFVNKLIQVSPEAEDKWVSDECLLENNVQRWTELPLWIPKSDEHPHGFFLVSNKKAREKGLTFRSITQTIEDTRKWFISRDNTDMKDGIGLEPSKEASLSQKCGK
ncbi:NAD-dependent epimerase/dehydratase family protein [Pontibacillus yanchengensis]|uniref:NAD-dependent epimerase/dehydratase family protein n=1 Tax=Pontibacillus yanchengensis TaxID=462910 RepID=A0ACC7VM11_9BACI|nr:NAD-dependent epimerase/dehydratase family protein [Pontibacillus yanchengensis]MYL55274.1 NAD-dependent epimerase/dehydratase family protein [Pontibacillus yanchengensis]